MKNKTPEIDEQKMQEYKDRATNYQTWRWNNVSFYQSIFIVFVTSTILIFVDLIAGKDISFKIFILPPLIFLSFYFYQKALRQTQKPIIVLDNSIGTIEGKSVKVKGEDGEEYSIFKISGAHHGVDRAE